MEGESSGSDLVMMEVHSHESETTIAYSWLHSKSYGLLIRNSAVAT